MTLFNNSLILNSWSILCLTSFWHLFTHSWINLKIFEFFYNDIANVLDKGHGVTVELMVWKFTQMLPRNRFIFFQFPSSYIHLLFKKIACEFTIFVIIFVNCLTKGRVSVKQWPKRIRTLFFTVFHRSDTYLLIPELI